MEGEKTMEVQELMKAAELIVDASSVVAFTGAGISVESGIPDFRSSGGLWSKYDPEVYYNYTVFRQRPELFWTMALDMHNTMAAAEPNAAHLALSELENMGHLRHVVTQNVDNLHQVRELCSETSRLLCYGVQRAGNKKVYELHGNATTASCMGCKHQAPINDAIEQLKSGKKVPHCGRCGGVLKMDAVLFGEPLPSSVMEAALRVCMVAEVMIVVGSSLVVSPANSLVQRW